ncbi:hypothetical protein TBC1_111754 [Lentimicrobium saccharophilum]|uniref:Uncharacterized protein n=1 Tax=Lentimicrobium saccharophilum TaxID=1678841 RepID=A0A0S7C0P6_9BACT|nr:hypothetical protein [Lentimicrobium saccharophilum]GAP43598.1 hypothetical protein TBC1_111754 [Lentimicrobium saccharophilum]
MASIDINTMRAFLSKSISSINQNKVNGMLAEIDLRNTLNNFGFGGRVSQGGWIMRNVGEGLFGHYTIVVFPQTIQPDTDYPVGRQLEEPALALHTICSTMHQIGVHSYYCVPSIANRNDYSTITWQTKQLGIPNIQPYRQLIPTISNFSIRERRYNFLRYNTDAGQIPLNSLAEEFTKEHLRVNFQNHFMSEMSDIDGILWGEQYTYPIEIKEKTPGTDNKLGEFFGIDVGPFVKLAYYAAKKGNLHSLFFVREINNINERRLVNWWFITFEKLALFASWVPIAGGINMQGGGSTVVKIPKSEFTKLTRQSLEDL